MNRESRFHRGERDREKEKETGSDIFVAPWKVNRRISLVHPLRTMRQPGEVKSYGLSAYVVFLQHLAAARGSWKFHETFHRIIIIIVSLAFSLQLRTEGYNATTVNVRRKIIIIKITQACNCILFYSRKSLQFQLCREGSVLGGNSAQNWRLRL